MQDFDFQLRHKYSVPNLYFVCGSISFYHFNGLEMTSFLYHYCPRVNANVIQQGSHHHTTLVLIHHYCSRMNELVIQQGLHHHKI